MRQRLGLSDEGHTLCDQLIREALEDMSRMDPITVDPDSDDSSVPDVIDA
jgi:hypothetical protein